MINIEFTQNEINNLLILLKKVNITGSEALAVVELQIKLTNALPKLPENVDREQKNEVDHIEK